MSSQDKFLKLSNYLILSSIGSGGFSKVYLIKDKKTGIKYAAKVSLFMVDEETQDQNETLAQFREVNLLSMIDHPSILKFIGFSQTNFEGDPTPTIVTEYASNGSLYDILEMEKSGLSIDGWDDTKKLIIIYGIASGMSYLHSHKIIHRDMKPQNILIDEFLHPKISDFGLSKINESLTVSMNMQSQKRMKGTPIYMAPEIFINEEYSEASDVYAFSIIVHEVFSMETPFIKLNFSQIIKKVSNGERPKINDFVPDAFKDLIQRCWSQEPDKRPTFSEIVEEIKTDNSYITDLMDELEFLDYVDFIENCESSFDTSKQLLHFDEFVKVYGRNKEIKKVVIDKENVKKKPIIITKDMLIFELDEDRKTACVIGNDEAYGDVLIPRSIIHKEQEFIVESIMKEAFSWRKQISSIQFPSDSELTYIEEKAFYDTKIDGCIKIPPHVKQIGEFAFGKTYFTQVEISEDSELQTINKGIFYASPINSFTIPSDIELKEGWCFDAYKLNDVKIIIKEKQNIKYYDNFIIGKTDVNSNEFDSLVFVPRNVDTVTIPPFIQRISSYAFSKSQIKEIVIPSNVTEIEKGAFYGCTKLKSIEIASDSKLRIIDEHVFENTTINKITIPSSVIKICNTAFYDCRKLLSIEFTPDSELQEIESNAFKYLPIESFKIPPHVKHINRKTFMSCKYLKTVTVAPNSELQTIEKSAFKYSPIENLCVPSSFVEFKDGWCRGAEKLKNISIMENKKHNIMIYKNKFIIGKTDVNNDEYDVLVFATRDIKTITIPSFIKKICSHAFAWSSIENIIITPQVEEIGYEAFCECQNLSHVEIQNGSKLSSIGKYAFYSSMIESILIPPHIKEIRKGTFLRCQKLSKIIFAKNSELKIIGKLAFASTFITYVKVPPSVQEFGESSFKNCQNLVQIETSSKSKLRTIENNAFENSSIESIIIPPNFAEFKEKWCYDTPKLNEVKIIGNNSTYKLEENGLILAKRDPNSAVYDVLFFVPRYMKTIIIEPFIKKIAPFAFSKSEIESIEIPYHISEIGMGAFLDCKKLKRASLSENSELREIPIKAFESSSIQEIKLPPHIIKICDHAFYNCSSLDLVDIPKNSELREIGSYSFRLITAKYIYLPKHLTKIDIDAFDMCRKFQTIEVAEDSELKIFDYKIFQCCEKDIVFKIPPHIKTINYDDFLKCRIVALGI